MPRQRSLLEMWANGQSRLERVMALVSALAIMALMFLTASEVIGRYLFNHPIPGSYEVSELMLIGVVFLSVAYVQSVRGHIKIELIDKSLGVKTKAILDMFGYLIGLVIMSIMTWQAGVIAWHATVTGEYYAGVIAVPLWPARLAFAFGIGLLSIRLLLDITRGVTTWKERRNEP